MTILEKEHSAPIGAALAYLAHADPAQRPPEVAIVDAALRRIAEARRLDFVAFAEHYRRFERLWSGDPLRAKQQAMKAIKTLTGVEIRKEALGILMEAMPSQGNARRERAMKEIAQSWSIPTEET